MFVGLLVVFLILLLFWIKSCRRPKNAPPGPWFKVPGLGHVEDIIGMIKYGAIESSLRNRETYGNIIYKEGILGMKVLHLFSFDLLEDGLNKSAMSDRIDISHIAPLQKVYGKIFKHGYHGIIGTSGKEWQDQRRFALRTLRDFGLGKSGMEEMILEELREFSVELRENLKEGPINLANKFNVMVINILWTTVAGERYDYHDEKFKDIIKKLNTAFGALAPNPRILLMILFPFLKDWFPDQLGYTDLIIGYHCVYEWIEEQIDKHQENLDEDNPNDFIDAYLIEMKKIEEKGDTDSSFYKELGRKCLICVIFDLFLAGSETTSTTLMWGVVNMMRNKEVQEKVHEELDSVVGRARLPRLQDQAKLPYTMAAIEELYRHSSLAPLAVQHLSNQEVELGGYVVPEKTTVIPNLYAVHHDKEAWGDPQNFRPERFLDEAGEFAKHQRVIPFGIGKRRCLGETLAKTEVFLLFAGLLHQFSFNVPDGEEPPTLEYIPGITLQPKPFTVTLKPRM